MKRLRDNGGPGLRNRRADGATVAVPDLSLFVPVKGVSDAQKKKKERQRTAQAKRIFLLFTHAEGAHYALGAFLVNF